MDDPVQVGRYEVQKVVGKGAMGVVYLAYDPQIGRRVALKTIRPAEGARPEEIEESRTRFLREARAAGKLLHPNIVTIFDVFEDRGVLYIAMEYAEGILLDHFCRRRNLLPLNQVIDLSSQALLALEYAHQAEIVHRDIKPGNLMVMAGQTLKVMDFGLARESGAHLTHSGTVIGTPHYMSPEQVQGHALDGRSDLFSMGVVLYELVTGERPFQGDSISTVIYRVLNEDPPPPRAVNPKVPESLSAVIRKALSKRPEDRFPTAAAFRQALLNPQDPDPVQTWINLERPAEVLPPSPATMDPPLLPPIPPDQRTAKQHSLSRKYGRFTLLALLIVAGGYLGLTRYQEYTGRAGQPITPPPSQEILPVALDVETVPPGAALFLDGTPVDAVTLAPNDSRVHTVEARLGCLSARTEVTGASTKGKIKLALRPAPGFLAVTSAPPGARISLDGKDTGLVTPAQIPLEDCRPFQLTLSREGYDPAEVAVDPQKQGTVDAPLTSLESHGTLKVLYPSGILQIYDGDRLLGTSGKALSLPAGDYDLKVVDPVLRGVREEAVKVTSGDEGVLKVPAFARGQVFLYGKPTNDGKVTVDGTRFDDLPLTGTSSLAVGPHEFLVVSPEGRKVFFAWTIRPGEQTRVVDFSTGRVETP
jgi:serine/threonine-protein kinase